jgi:hypothetical protein
MGRLLPGWLELVIDGRSGAQGLVSGSSGSMRFCPAGNMRGQANGRRLSTAGYRVISRMLWYDPSFIKRTVNTRHFHLLAVIVQST